MNNELAITVTNLSKVYKLYDNPVDRLKESIHPFRKKYSRDFYALKDVSFQVEKGSTLGIVGKNGSGKSTLLKIVTGVLTPTAGNLVISGKISALLELGAGFNPDLTGIENVYLNGTLHGFTRDAVAARLPEILAFADIGDFVHQPIKMYSSGMMVRLAFAAAINIDPDILIVDEALAVGDAKFQRKCYAKFENFKKTGKTVLFVSHSSETIKQFCDRAILLDEGVMVAQGEPDAITKIYFKRLFGEDTARSAQEKEESDRNGRSETELNELQTKEKERLKELIKSRIRDSQIESAHEREFRLGNRKAEIIDFGLYDMQGNKTSILEAGRHYRIFSRALFYSDADTDDIFLGIGVANVKGLVLYWTNTILHNVRISGPQKGDLLEGQFTFVNHLGPGDYFVSFVVRDMTDIYDRRADALHVKVYPSSEIGNESVVNLKSTVTINILKNDALA
jgi:ABC-type polysaccharide/polyol phosphate transport system ATPase subunit